jgi:putative restriction endonuclease
VRVDLSKVSIGVRYDRPTLARLWGYKGLQALSKGVVTEKGSPIVLLFVTRIKQAAFTQYNDYISGDQLYWEGEKGHSNDERIHSARSNGSLIHLFYREIHHTLFEYKGPIELIEFHQETTRPSRATFRIVHDQGSADDISAHEQEISTIPTTEQQAIINARIGQGVFRQRLLELWHGCAVTGVFLPQVLKASHIKPWRFSTNQERLDPFNGILLLPQYDSLFDAGLISFTDDGAILRSRSLGNHDLQFLGIRSRDRLRKVSDSHRFYLAYHRNKIFHR